MHLVQTMFEDRVRRAFLSQNCGHAWLSLPFLLKAWWCSGCPPTWTFPNSAEALRHQERSGQSHQVAKVINLPRRTLLNLLDSFVGSGELIKRVEPDHG